MQSHDTYKTIIGTVCCLLLKSKEVLRVKLQSHDFVDWWWNKLPCHKLCVPFVPPVSFGGGKCDGKLLQNFSIYPPPLLICSLTQLCASIQLYVTCTATCARFTPTHIFQHTPLSPVKWAHPALPHSAASQNWHISCTHAWRLWQTKDLEQWSVLPPSSK